MNAIDIDKLKQLISRTDMSGNDKVRWLTDFIDGRELQQEERSYSEEEVIQFGKFLTEFNNLDNEIECAIKKLLKQFKNK